MRKTTPFLVLLLYALLMVVMTWPVVGQLGSHIPGNEGDAWMHMWTFDWVKQALANGRTPFHTPLIFFPDGASLVNHNIAWLNIAAWLPLQALFNAGAAYSIVFLSIFIFNGFAVYLFARDTFKSETAAFLAGLIVAFWPYTLSHQNHPNLIFIGWIPLAALYLGRFLRDGGRRNAILSTLFIALIGYARWQLLAMGIFLIAPWMFYIFITHAEARTVRRVGQVALIGLVAGLLMAPLVAPIIQYQLTRANPEDLFIEEKEAGEADLLSYFVPNQYHPLWGDASWDQWYTKFPSPHLIRTIGYVTLILATIGVLTRWRQTRFWLLTAVFLILIALGSHLRFNGETYFKMPYALVENLFIFRIIRRPDRFNVLLGIPFGMMAAAGYLTICHWLRGKAKPLLILGGLSLLILAEYVVVYPTMALEVPAWYAQLANEEGDFATLDIPLERRFDEQYMFYQTAHGKPMIEGHVSRPPREAFAFIESVPLLNSLQDAKSPPDDILDISNQMRILDEANIKYTVLHKRFLTPSQIEEWKQWLWAQPFHEDGELLVYRTADVKLPADFEFLYPMTEEEGAALLEATIVPTATTPSGWVEVFSHWSAAPQSAIAPPTADYDLCFDLIGEDGATAESHCQELAAGWPTSAWQPYDIVRTRHQFKTGAFLASGGYTIAARLTDGGISHPAQPIGKLTIEPTQRQFDPPAPPTETTVRWNEGIALVGYDLDAPEITFYWYADGRLPRSYKIFLHLINAESGEVAAQLDYIPRDWTYPTNFWEAGEYVAETVALPVEGLPSGTYKIYVGWYDPENGARLTAGEDGDAVFLAEVLVGNN